MKTITNMTLKTFNIVEPINITYKNTYKSNRFYILKEKEYDISLCNLTITNQEKTLLINPFVDDEPIIIKNILYFKLENNFVGKFNNNGTATYDDNESFFINFTILKTYDLGKLGKRTHQIITHWIFNSEEQRNLILDELNKLFIIKENTNNS